MGLVAAAIGAVWYLRTKKDDGSNGKKDSKKGSAFKFPDAKSTSTAARRPNSKKSKAKARKAEKQKAEKQKAKAGSGAGKQQNAQQSKKGGGKEDTAQASTSVINYTYFDSARRDTLIPIHKKKSLTAKDIMDKDQELQKQNN